MFCTHGTVRKFVVKRCVISRHETSSSIMSESPGDGLMFG